MLGRWKSPVLPCVWRASLTVGNNRQRVKKALFQVLPLGTADVNLEGVPQEIVGPRVLIEAPHEINHGVDEVLLFTGGRVEQQVAPEFKSARR